MSNGSAAARPGRQGAQGDRPSDRDARTEVLRDVVVPEGPWPHGVPREPTMRISDVLQDLQADFPALTPSKLRFLEEQGLVEPRRTSGRYRLYSPADVERVRYVLRQQRDRYLPLRVIREQLTELDAGRQDEPVLPRLAARDGERTATAPVRRGVRDLAESTGVAEETVQMLVDEGVLTPGPGGRLPRGAEEVVAAAAALADHGVDARHLRSFRSAAERQLSVVDQLTAPLRSQRAASAQANASVRAAELGELCVRLHAAYVRAGVGELDH